MGKRSVHLTQLFPLLQCILVGVGGDYRLEILVDQYQNPLHLQADGDCCNWDTQRHQCAPCHNRFTFCLLKFGTVSELSGFGSYDFDTYVCDSHPHYTTGVVRGGRGSTLDPDDLWFAENGYIDEQNNILNPLVFTGNGSWPGKFQLVVKIKNWKSFLGEDVDLIAEDWELPISETFSQRRLSGLKLHANLTVSARVTCTEEKLCQKCTQVCGSLLDEEVPLDATGDAPGNGEPILANNSNESRPGDLNNGFRSEGSGTSSQNRLTIALSVTGTLLVLLLLTAIIVVCAYLRRRRRKHGFRSRGERRPFLQRADNIDHSNYMSMPGTATDEDSGDENFSNSSSRASKLYQPLPATVPDDTREQYQPRLLRTGQIQNSNSRAGATEPLSSEYSIIMRRDLDLTPAQSLEDIPEVSEEEEEGGRDSAGYSMIRQEDMDTYVSEGVSEEEEEGEQREERRDIADRSNESEQERPRMPTPPGPHN